MKGNPTANEFSEKLVKLQSTEELKKYERFFPIDKRGGDKFIGVRMGQIFKLAKEFESMELGEIEKLLENPIHEIRVGAVSIMDFQARSKKTTEERKKALFDLYIRRYDRINTWDLVDRSGFWVVGNYLLSKPREILYKLAVSKNMAERRTAIIATGQIATKTGKTDDTFKIAEILLDDRSDLIHKAVGWMLRVAGDINRQELIDFLEKHAVAMPRNTLRYSIKHFDKIQRDRYLTRNKG